MSSVLILLLFLVLAAPALIAFLRSEVGWKTGAFYGLVSILLLGWYVGFSFGAMPDAASLRGPPDGLVLEGDRCEQALATAQRGGIVLDRRNPDRLVVSARVWPQLPENLKGALTQCANAVRPAARRDRPVEVISR